MYYCFGCGAGGNVFTFLMEYENFTFSEAMEALADRAGIELPKQEMTSEARREADKRNILFEINKEAAKYFYMSAPQRTRKISLPIFYQKRDCPRRPCRSLVWAIPTNTAMTYTSICAKRAITDEVLKDSGLVTIDEARAST